MKHYLKHKGYYCEIYYSEEDECYIGRVLGIKSMLAVHEDTAADAIIELIESIDDYLLVCAEEGRMPNSTDPKVAHEVKMHLDNGLSDGLYATWVEKELAFVH